MTDWVRRVLRPLAGQARRMKRDPDWGRLRRFSPLDPHYGYHRGTPIDRYYIARFLETARSEIRGDVLEVKDDLYSSNYGGERIRSVDVLDIDPANRAATVVGDLAAPGTLRQETYDCALVTQTLYLLDDPVAGLTNLYRSLRPGGTLLLTNPLLCQVDSHSPTDQWRLTPLALHSILARVGFAEGELLVEGHGNLVTAVAYLYGMATEELEPSELTRADPRYPIVVTARARKPS